MVDHNTRKRYAAETVVVNFPHASISLVRHQSDFRRGAEIGFDRFDTMLRAVA